MTGRTATAHDGGISPLQGPTSAEAVRPPGSEYGRDASLAVPPDERASNCCLKSTEDLVLAVASLWWTSGLTRALGPVSICRRAGHDLAAFAEDEAFLVGVAGEVDGVSGWAGDDARAGVDG